MAFVGSLLFALIGLAASSPSFARAPGPSDPVTVSAINLRWFGLNAETRSQSIKQYFSDQRLLADVMVFEEIVDVPMLQRDILGSGYTCRSYDGVSANHQHVVVCHRSTLRLDMAEGETNYALESVNTSGRLRPAVHGILKNSRGERLLHIFGVHLKAMSDSSSVRLTQVQRLADYMANARDPVLVIGDFNTFNADPDKMDEIFSTVGMSQVDMAEPFTWASASEDYPPAKFDRVWVSDRLLPRVADERVVGPCSSNDDAAIGAYNAKVSDHCGLRLTLMP